MGAATAGPLTGAAESSVVRTLAGDTALWTAAARIAQSSRWFLPGRATVHERASQDANVIESSITARLQNGGAREQRLAIDSVQVDGEDKTKTQKEEMAASLGELVESLYTPDHPLARHTAREILRTGETVIDGAHCVGFITQTTVDDLSLESTIWIDVARGYARRIDYRAINLPLRKDRALLRALSGRSDYALDSAGHWILVRHNEHTDLQASSLLGSIELRSDKTIADANHWEYKGPRRSKAPPAAP